MGDHVGPSDLPLASASMDCVESIVEPGRAVVKDTLLSPTRTCTRLEELRAIASSLDTGDKMVFTKEISNTVEI